MKYFSIPELTKSTTAAAHKIDNTPGTIIKAHLVETIDNLLDPIRAYYGKPIKISSGYRCSALNALVGGAASSSHLYGYAADIKPSDGKMAVMQAAVLAWAKSHRFDQIILEQCDSSGIASWIHVGWKRGINGVQRKQYLIAKRTAGKWVYSSFNNK